MQEKWRIYGMLKGYNIPSIPNIQEVIYKSPVQELREGVIEYLIKTKRDKSEKDKESIIQLLCIDSVVSKIKIGSKVSIRANDELNGTIGYLKQNYGQVVEIKVIEPKGKEGHVIFVPVNSQYEIVAL